MEKVGIMMEDEKKVFPSVEELWDASLITDENFMEICSECGYWIQQHHHRYEHIFTECDNLIMALNIFKNRLHSNILNYTCYVDQYQRMIIEARENKIKENIYGQNTLLNIMAIEQSEFAPSCDYGCDDDNYKYNNFLYKYPRPQKSSQKSSKTSSQSPIPLQQHPISFSNNSNSNLTIAYNTTPLNSLKKISNNINNIDQIIQGISCNSNLVRTYENCKILPRTIEIINDSEQFASFLLPNAALGYRSYICLDYEDCHLQDLQLGNFEFISKVDIESNGCKIMSCTGLQLYCFYKNLNPFFKPWEQIKKIPLPLIPRGSHLTFFCGFNIDVTYKTGKIDCKYVYEQLNDILFFMPDDITKYISLFVGDKIIVPKIHIEELNMSLDPKEEDWFFKSVHNIKIHQFSNIIQITKDILHPIVEIFPKFRGRVCILCMVFYNPKTRKYFSSLDPYPIRKFQLVLNNLVSEYDAETLHHTEKLKHHLNISPQVQLFTRIFKKPAVFEYPTNYVITGTKLNINDAQPLNISSINEFSCVIEWNCDEKTVPHGTCMYLWTITENEMLYKDGLCVIKYST
jgi:hypothetical protein